MYKKTISIEAQLQKIVNINPEYGELWSTWNLNKKTLEPILNAIIKDYPHYSFHDHSHSESILLNIERVLGNDNIEKLSPTDLWLLLHVAYLHDFGMVILDTKIQDFWKTSDFQEYLREQMDSEDEDFKRAANIVLSTNRDEEQISNIWPLEVKAAVTLLTSKYCRWQHGDFSRNYILDVNNVWGIDIGHNGLIKKRLVSLIADISAMHTKPFEDLYKLHKEANGFKGDYAHPRLIASLLRLGDVLDLDNGRFNRYGEKIFGKMPSDSKVHYGKHEATSHVLINNELIEVEADCPTDSIYRETRRWYDSLKEEVERMHLNWSDIATKEFSHPPKLAPYRILRNGVEDANELSNLKFTISQNKAFEILEGTSIYKDKFSCIREIIQNAEDATKIQLWRDIKKGMYYCDKGINKEKVETGNLMPKDIPEWIYQIYLIQITIERNEDNNAVVSVYDHGTGISLDSLKLICNVGQSYFQEKKRKQEIEEMPIWLRPTANFGIGLQSCFMVTDKITIYTNSDQDGSYKMIFKSGKQEGYVNVETKREKLARGSKVEIVIPDNLNFSYSIFGYTANKLMEIEPFESNCIVIYKVIESIFQECGSSFFDINVSSKSVKFKEKISSNISKNHDFPKEPFSNGYYVLNKDKDTIIFWYKNNLYTILLEKDCEGTVNVKFKGKTVKKNRIDKHRYICFRIDVDIYGITTKKALSLNREELSNEAAYEVCEDIDYLISEFLDLLLKQKDAIRDKKDLIDALMLSACLYGKVFPQDLHENVSDEKNIRTLIFDKEKQDYVAENCSLYDIKQKFPKLPYISCEVVSNPRAFMERVLTEEKLIEVLKNSNIDKKNYNRIIIDNNLKMILSRLQCDLIYLNGKLDDGEDLGICLPRIDDELYEPDKYTETCLIKNLVHNGGWFRNGMSNMRRAIPAFAKYSKLAVELKDIYFVSGAEYSKWKIISPISLKDSKKMGELSKEAFVEFILNQTPFNNLVKYVVEHGKIKESEEVIVNEYKRLIADYYSIMTSKNSPVENVE